MIHEIELIPGRTPTSGGATVQSTPVVIFVGPNNSGKSLALRELNNYCVRGEAFGNRSIIKKLSFTPLSRDQTDLLIQKLQKEPEAGESHPKDHIILGIGTTRTHVHYPNLLRALQNPQGMNDHFCNQFLRHFTRMLDGPSRIQLVNGQPAEDLLKAPKNTLHVLFSDDQKREMVREIIYKAFGKYLVIDPTVSGCLRIRLSNRPPNDSKEEQSLDKAARDFHSSAQLIDSTSDGVKAFVGIIIELIAGDPKVLIIDEPEAFLHPALAASLGEEIARAAGSEDKKVFVSTHSAAFLMGCVQSGVPLTIIRLTYRDGIATARHLPSTGILEIMRNPLLRSTNVLNGLFFESVLVGEADTDRAFYEEINYRMNQGSNSSGIPNCLFLNAMNKQTTHQITRPLREMGIPAASIVDIDVVKEGGGVWTSFLEGATVPGLEHTSLGQHRKAVLDKLVATGRDMKKEGGIQLLSGQDKESAENLFKKLGEYGLFVVPGGEVESWLAHLGATGHGPKWLLEMFEKMGSDPADPGYVRPGTGDVWQFMNGIQSWLLDANRKGIPK